MQSKETIHCSNFCSKENKRTSGNAFPTQETIPALHVLKATQAKSIIKTLYESTTYAYANCRVHKESKFLLKC